MIFRYNSNEAHQGEADEMMASLEPLLFEAKVDFLFAGHVHAYERSVRKSFLLFFSCLSTLFLLFVSLMKVGGMYCFLLHYFLAFQTRVYQKLPHSEGIIHITIGDGGNREGLATE